MFLCTLRLVPLAGQRQEMIEILRSIQGPTLAQEGCIACRIYEELGGASAILFCESWEGEACLQRHVCSDLYQRVLAAIELCVDHPDVCFHRVASTEGLELIERLRCPGDPVDTGKVGRGGPAL